MLYLDGFFRSLYLAVTIYILPYTTNSLCFQEHINRNEKDLMLGPTSSVIVPWPAKCSFSAHCLFYRVHAVTDVDSAHQVTATYAPRIGWVVTDTFCNCLFWLLTIHNLWKISLWDCKNDKLLQYVICLLFDKNSWFFINNNS